MYVPECIEYRYHRIANLRGSPVATEYAEIKNLRALLTLENVYHAGNRTPGDNSLAARSFASEHSTRGLESQDLSTFSCVKKTRRFLNSAPVAWGEPRESCYDVGYIQ